MSGSGHYDEARLSDYLFIPDELFPADFAIVFGMTGWRRPLERALRLYRDGLVRRLVFTGGFNPRIGVAEAEAMAAEALRLGIPQGDFLVDDKATNTAENVANARRLIDADLAGPHSVILVAIHFHLRRVRMTAEKVFPRSIRIGVASYPSVHYTRDNWRTSERGRSDVFGEIGKIARYLGADLSSLETGRKGQRVATGGVHAGAGFDGR